MYRVADDISLTKLDNTIFDVPSVEESKRSRKDLKHFLTPIKSSAHVHVIISNDTERHTSISLRYSNLGEQHLMI